MKALSEFPLPHSRRSTLLVSVHPEFANAILAGTKQVELRRQLPRFDPRGKVVIYSSSPVKAIVGSFTVASIERLPLAVLWRRVRSISGIDRLKFDNYFEGLTHGVGIFVETVEEFSRPIQLDEIRRQWPGFHPPQSFVYPPREKLEWMHVGGRRRRAA
ncbi:MAG: ASCH domain-containing protein [Planctomycetaceae bacterium]|nr:ASCH domain-containing protein [Planctomycetaceae bacterium]